LSIVVRELPGEGNQEVLAEKDLVIQELKETIEIMELKIKKMEELVKIKDSKIQTLTDKIAQANDQP
jgi:chaperonin cofactor prefoldin